MSKLETEDDVRRLIEEYEYEDVIIFSNPSYASAFMGISEDNRAIYDFDLMVEWLMFTEDFNEVEAIEWIETDTIRALPYIGDKAPIIMHRLED